MKSILVPLRTNEDIESVLDHAVTVARRFDSYIEGMVVEPVFQIAVGEAMAAVPAYDTQMLEEWRARAKAVHAKFDAIMRQAGVSAGWQEFRGIESNFVGEYGRLFDLIVIGRSPSDDVGEVTETCEAALFDSGRPVLLAPGKPVKALGETVVISWNGSTETARTIALGRPFLDAAKSVFVLTVEGATVSGPTGEQVAAYLARRGIEAKALTAAPGERSQGEAILEETAALGADLLLKGAYTHSRLRQMVFGGPTKHILSHAALPVLMAH
jgi:nucleotide-binding universal stress UspA family protein